ncbi:hypothetical protein ACFV9C_42960 [Kribbella sp. NPDC059898]|uniref:hypothetical protein n=1 Tax=Kribbella sp. NPDC059898 TaxID=3346995 RepID=UPI00364984E2
MTIASIENFYPDRQSWAYVVVECPADLTPEGIEDWWEDVVFPHTGDGRGQREYAIYTATVMVSDLPELAGLVCEWDG